ncbi:MAG: TIGR04423 family type III CRISPR-associated protein [Saprospiraceae bacterium]
MLNVLNIKNFPKGEYTGYYWYSDQTDPELITKPKEIDASIFTDLPFVIEGAFYNKTDQISIHVKNIDDQYYCTSMDLKQLSPKLYSEQYYKSHDLGPISKYKVFEVWEEVTDELLENMKTLKPAYTIFGGFD